MPSKFFIPVDDSFSAENVWDGFTLILPCVSVGNVPQLAVDLLVNTLLDKGNGQVSNDLKLIGYILSQNVCPYAGPDPFSLKGNLLATSIQGIHLLC